MKLQKTIKDEAKIVGKGLFTGEESKVVFRPAPEDSGVVFVRTDVSEPVRISAITANIANSYNRDVFAVPGRNNDKYSQGCNHLIKINKAALIQSADDIIYIMGWEEESKKTIPKQHKLFVKLEPNEEKIVKLLQENAESGIDWLCLNSQLPMSKVASLLLNLEFSGIVKSLPGKMYRLN